MRARSALVAAALTDCPKAVCPSNHHNATTTAMTTTTAGSGGNARASARSATADAADGGRNEAWSAVPCDAIDGANLTAAVDSRGGRVVIHGWKTTIDLTPLEAIRATGAAEVMHNSSPRPSTIRVADEQKLALGDMELLFFHTPGHIPDLTGRFPQRLSDGTPGPRGCP